MVEKKSGEREKMNIRFNSWRCERRLLVQLNTHRSECRTLKEFLSLIVGVVNVLPCFKTH